MSISEIKEMLESLVVDDEAENGSSEDFIRLKDHKYLIVSKIAYLLGVHKNYFGEGRNFDEKEFKSLELNKPARIIRNLCIIRTEIERGYKSINNGVKNENRNVINMVSQSSVMSLASDGVKLSHKPGTRPSAVVVDLNRLIQERIDNCKSVFPTWLNWNYVRSMFIIPGGLTEKGTFDAADLYYRNLSFYPYKKFFNWENPVDEGNILRNDKTFVNLLYQWNHDEFPAADQNKLMDASEYVKSNIYEFLERAKTSVDMVVDCENSDVYNIISMFTSLKEEHYVDRIGKIILVNDPHTNLGWQQLEKYTRVPIEHIMTERIKEDKSLVDLMLIGKIYEEHYEGGIKSFILLSSDSDFWAVMELLKKRVDFLVMVEHTKCGPDLKRKLEEEMIFYCYLDDFYAGEKADEMKNDMLLKYVGADLVKRDFSISDLLDSALTDLRIDLTESQKKQFYERYLKRLELSVDNGKVSVRIKG